MNNLDCRLGSAQLYLLPIATRVPLKFGTEALSSVTCARVCAVVRGEDGATADGWGETPMSVQWVWPSALSYSQRYDALLSFVRLLVEDFARFDHTGHPMEISHAYIENRLEPLRNEFNSQLQGEPLPHLAALVAFSPIDIALHDAYARLHGVGVYETYGPPYLTRDLASFLEGDQQFAGKFPRDYFRKQPLRKLPAWHLVGGLDPLEQGDLTGDEPDDGHPNLLADWIARDGLQCLKIKLRGNDASWDYDRLVRVGQIGQAGGVTHLTADFNCTVTDPQYVVDVLQKLESDHPTINDMMSYVEQPFPYELEENPIDVHSVSALQPLFLDESAHDWRLVRFGKKMGWTGVALKTCKTQTGALLAGCWAQQHGMQLMVQDLTNPMLAQIPHVLLAAHMPTIMGVETNGMQFYPEASAIEARVHPGIYQRRGGTVDLGTLSGAGFGYRVEEIARELPEVDCEFGEM